MGDEQQQQSRQTRGNKDFPAPPSFNKSSKEGGGSIKSSKEGAVGSNAFRQKDRQNISSALAESLGKTNQKDRQNVNNSLSENVAKTGVEKGRGSRNYAKGAGGGSGSGSSSETSMESAFSSRESLETNPKQPPAQHPPPSLNPPAPALVAPEVVLPLKKVRAFSE